MAKDPFETAAQADYQKIVYKMTIVRDPQNPADFDFLDALPGILRAALQSKGFEVNEKNLDLAYDQIDPNMSPTFLDLGPRAFDQLPEQDIDSELLLDEVFAESEVKRRHDKLVAKAAKKDMFVDGASNLHERIRDVLVETLRRDSRFADVTDNFQVLHKAQDIMVRALMYQAQQAVPDHSHLFWQAGGIRDLSEMTRLKVKTRAFMPQVFPDADSLNEPSEPLH